MSPARHDSKTPIGFSTKVPSTSSQSRFSWSRMLRTSRSVAMPGGGFKRTRRGEMPPNCFSKSSKVESSGKSERVRGMHDSFLIEAVYYCLGGDSGQDEADWQPPCTLL